MTSLERGNSSRGGKGGRIACFMGYFKGLSVRFNKRGLLKK